VEDYSLLLTLNLGEQGWGAVPPSAVEIVENRGGGGPTPPSAIEIGLKQGGFEADHPHGVEIVVEGRSLLLPSKSG